MTKDRGYFPRLRRLLRWTFRLLLIFMIVDLGYIAVIIWPDWSELAAGAVPRSNFIEAYQASHRYKGWPSLQWRPVPLATIPPHVVRAVLIAEDIRFYHHSGFDLIAIREALDYNLAEGRVILGASTISQQTAKNLFLNPERTPLRKWHELILTWGMEQNLTKKRILEIYLNTAEFGRGVYGVEAAAQLYWGIPITHVSVVQAAELAATLPGPTKNNPATRTNYFLKRVNKILSLLAREYDRGAGPETLPPLPAAEPNPRRAPAI